MPNPFFQFKQFTIRQEKSAMKVTTDGCLFGACVAEQISKKAKAEEKMLDIGAGTGLLSLMVTQKTPGTIDAIELDEQAFEQAKENITASPWSNRIELLHGDATDFSFPKQYDYIFSNPPFYENELRSGNKQKDIAHHHDGLTLVELVKLIEQNLKKEGSFYLLLPHKRKDEILKVFNSSSLNIHRITLVRQSVNHDYFRMMLEGNFTDNSVEEISYSELAIRQNENAYTAEFISLLKDYYLHL